MRTMSQRVVLYQIWTTLATSEIPFSAIEALQPKKRINKAFFLGLLSRIVRHRPACLLTLPCGRLCGR